MTDRELMKQALEALEQINELSKGENAIALPGEIDGAMEALHAALNAPEPEWVGLTEDEVDDIWNRYCDEMGEASINDAEDIARAIEAKLKEKNT